MTRRWTTSLWIWLFVLFSTLAWRMTAQAVVIDNFQSAFRTEGADLNFTFDFSGWDGGTEVVPPDFISPGAAFREFGTFGGGTGGTGLGVIEVAIARAAGAVGTVSGNFHTYFDFEVDEADNTFFNEFGNVSALANSFNPTSFEIDEPGFLFPPLPPPGSDIFFNFEDGTLDNTNSIPSSMPEDVAVAFGWDMFSLNPGDTALLTLVISDSGLTVADQISSINPLEVFTLQHIDPDSPATITYSGALQITSSTPPVIPEPSSLLLFLGCLSGLGIAILRRKRKLH